MQNRRSVTFAVALIAAATLSAQAQESGKAHWGVQADFAGVNVPKAIIERVEGLPEQPSIAGRSHGVGVVRFHADGAPSYALQYSRLYVNIEGSGPEFGAIRQISGAATLRGFMATKYVNFVRRRFVSGGLAVGGGVGNGRAHYVRNVTFQGTPYFVEANSYDRTIPLFEILGRVDVRPVKYVSVGPYYGIRNGTLALGVALRLHAVR